MPAPPLTASVLADGNIPLDPVLSPDGRWVCYAVAGPGAASDRPVSALWTADSGAAAAPRPLTGGTARDRRPRWDPGAGHLYFLSDRSGPERGASRLHRIALDGTGLSALTGEETEVVDHLPLPGGAAVAVVVGGPGPRGDAPRVWGEPEPHDRLALLDTGTGRLRPVGGPGEPHVLEAAARPDGAALAVIGRPGAERDPVRPRWDLHLVDPATGRAECLGGLGWEAHSPAWWHDGRRWHLSYLATTPGPDGGQAVFDLVPGAAPRRRADLTEGMDRCPVELVQADEGPPLALFARGLDTEVHRLDPGTGRFAPLHRFPGLLEELTCDRTGSRVAVAASTASTPREVHAGPAGAPPARLTRLRPELDRFARAGRERLSYRARDGLALDGLLLTPVGAAPDEGPFPLVTWVHGGPYGRYADQMALDHHAPAEWLAHAGYAVFLPNPRGGEGRGRAFAEAVVGALGGGEWDDIEDGIDLLVRRGTADPGRLGIGGWSHGGTMAAWAVGRTGRFRAAVVGAGVSDWGMLAATGEYGACEAGLSGSVGWEGPGPHPHDAVSPVSYASRIRTPVLILHGEEDRNVPVGQAVYLHRALRRFGVGHAFVRYPGEGHAVVGRENRIDVMRRVRAWFDRWLAR
ncbi:S9 family peptidase [Nocardiopsis potens]|uniref:S9 family peptidase n=1 Tax=Nocardiopsis potens TaxID=1246458 RepID=UPI00034A1D8A|nr:prolyl oligopeptidase family serine peptidase [Nocardiopsis potens]